MSNPDQHPLNTLLAHIHQWRLLVAHLVALPDFSEAESSALRKTVQQEGSLGSGYILMCALSAGIAILGLLQSSVAVVIGAMLVSPLMSPIAALGFGFASLDGHRIRDAVRVVIIGAVIGIITGMMLTWISPIRNATPEIIGRTQPTLLQRVLIESFPSSFARQTMAALTWANRSPPEVERGSTKGIGAQFHGIAPTTMSPASTSQEAVHL